jgi:glycine oxidase
VTTKRVAVVGGGIVGASIAFEIARSLDSHVVLVDAAQALGQGATAAAIGGITPQSESYCRGPLRYLAVWSTRIYPEFIDRLETASNTRIPVLDTGQLQVALTESEMTRIARDLLPAWDAEGFETIVLSAAETLSAEPSLTKDVHGSVLLPIEFALEPRRLIHALAVTLGELSNVEMRMGTTVTTVTSSADMVRIETDTGDVIHAEFAVIAAGMDSPALLPTLANRIYPMRGQAIEFRTGHASYPLRHHIYAAIEPTISSYLVPRNDGRAVGGVTYEPNDRRMVVDEGIIAKVRTGLIELCPEVATWEVIRSWAGVRPASIDGIPFVGPIDEWERVLCCSGHQGLGVTLAPACSVMVRDLIGVEPQLRSSEVAQALEICTPGRTSSVGPLRQ